MAQYEFSIHYSGNALETGRMPVKDLAPALLAISGAFQEMQRIKFPDQPPISLEINSTKKGSFIVELLLTNGKDFFSQMVDLLTCKESDALLNLIELTTIFGTMYKLIRSKSKKEEKQTDGKTKITIDNGETIVLDDSDIKIYRSIEFRTHIKNSVSPLENEGVNQIEFSSKKTETITIIKNDLKSFDVPPIKDEVLEPTVSVLYLQLLNVAFEHGKWKFSNGTNQFFATIEDEDFMDSVKQGKQKFSTNDRLKVQLRTEQKATSSGLKTDFFIEKVLEHVHGAIQLELDFTDSVDEK